MQVDHDAGRFISLLSCGLLLAWHLLQGVKGNSRAELIGRPLFSWLPRRSPERELCFSFTLRLTYGIPSSIATPTAPSNLPSLILSVCQSDSLLPGESEREIKF